MNKIAALVAMIGLALGSGAACKKKDKVEPSATAPAADSAAGSAAAEGSATPAEKAAAEKAAAEKAAADKAAEDEAAAADKADKQAKLEYAQMEDRYLNDPKGQWASEAKASSSFGSANEAPADSKDSNTPWQVTGAPNGNSWSNNNQEMGIDWIQVKFAKPVTATELRVVQTGGVGSVSKIELFDEAGAAHEIWAGADETTTEKRGQRTWLVKTFEKTAYKVAGAKVSFANAVVSGYKEVDAIQIVGE